MISTEEKIKLIIDQSEKHDITAYEYGNKTEVSVLGAKNILDRTSKNPRNKTLNIMLDYIEKKIVGTKYKEGETQNLVAEPIPGDLAEALANKVIEKLKPHLEKMELQEAVLAKLLLELSSIKDTINR